MLEYMKMWREVFLMTEDSFNEHNLQHRSVISAIFVSGAYMSRYVRYEIKFIQGIET